MRLLQLLSGFVYAAGMITEMYLNWANSPIKIKAVLTWFYVFGTSVYFIMQTSVLGWTQLSRNELQDQTLIASLWFILAFVAIGRVINGSIANYEEAKRKLEERENKKGWV
ncbi:hypothetical protein ACFYU8_18570 [Brevibacillus sp. NPDC003359]|uniref:hypothetical protein n=1 Tax=unclassified Brevibacillus TaxID=2684853 RepID=UPI0036D07EDC